MKKVLWVEDEARDQLLELLGPVWQAGYFVDIAEDKVTALDKISNEKYDAYIIDLIIGEGKLSDTQEKESKGELHGLDLIKEIFNEDSQIHIDPSKCAIFSVVGSRDIHDQIRRYGISNIIVKKEMGRTRLKEIIESITEKGDQDIHNI